jgi:hypothetical protein
MAVLMGCGVVLKGLLFLPSLSFRVYSWMGRSQSAL